MERNLQEKYDMLNIEPGGSGAQGSSSDYTSTDSDSAEESPAGAQYRENLTEDYENELEVDLTKTLPKHKQVRAKDKKPKVRKQLSKIPVHLKGLMGEANLRFARGDRETAEKMCYEVVRQEPHAHEPYVTLSQLYETEHPEKSMQYLTIAAHLNPSDVDQWLRLAQLYVAKNEMRPAVTCFTRAIQADPKNTELHDKRIQLLEALGDHRFALRCKVRLLQIYSRKQHTLIMETAKQLAEIFHKERDFAKAIEIFNVPFAKCRKHITPEMVNIYLELLLANHNYPQCLDVFVQFCNIEIEIELKEAEKIVVISYSIPDQIPVDLQMKFVICLVMLESYEHAETLLTPLLVDETNVERIGDLYLDVAEAYMLMGKHLDALKLLIPLIKSKNFSLAAVWLKHAECLRKCEMPNEAIESYYNVVRLAPQHMEVRYPLSELLLQTDRVEDALEILNQDPNSAEIDVGLLLKRMEILRHYNLLEHYFKSVELLLKRHCIVFLHITELRSVTFQETIKEKIQRVNKLRDFRGEPPIVMGITSVREPPIDEEYRIFKDILNFCYKNGHYKRFRQFAFSGLGSTRFKSYAQETIVYALFACICTKDSHHSYAIIREQILRKNNANNHFLWNLFNLTMQTQDEFRHNRFVMRQNKLKNLDFFKILEANNALSSGSYKIASIYLMPFLKAQPTPFIYLMLGVVFLQVSCQKHRELKKKLTLCSYGLLLTYANRRGKAAYHEVCYNLGRLYHQFGVLHIAAHYYNIVLEFKHPLIEQHPDVLDLTREAAFNLHLIYKDSENYIGARNLLKKYITI